MKKSIKGLILGVLASLVTFALVYAKPMVAQAGSYSFSGTEEVDRGEYYEYWDEDEGEYVTDWRSLDSYDSHYSLYFSWTGHDSEDDGLDEPDPLYIDIYEEDGIMYMDCSLCFLNLDPDATGTCSYNITCNGVNYIGMISLINDDDETYWNGYLWIDDFILTPYSDTSEGYHKAINDLKGMIGNITNDSNLTGDNRVIEFSEGTALPKDVIAAMATSSNVTLKFTFVYDGFEFCTTITSDAAKEVFNSEIGWYGPCFLAENFPTVWTGKTA